MFNQVGVACESSGLALSVGASQKNVADALAERLHFALGEVTIATVRGFEFATLDGDDRLGETVKVTAKHHERLADSGLCKQK